MYVALSCGAAPPGGPPRIQPALRVKMAAGLLQRVGSGLSRAKRGAESAGQLVLWSRWGGFGVCVGGLCCRLCFNQQVCVEVTVNPGKLAR